MVQNYLKNIIVIVSSFLLMTTAFPTFSNQTYVWSVVPQFTGTAVHRDWVPLINKIQEKTGYQFKIKIYQSIKDFELGFLQGHPDFAYMNPYHALMAKKSNGYLPIIRNNARLLTGILVARKDSGINNIEDLSNQVIAFPAPNAFAASLYMRALLTQKENANYKTVYAGTHSNSYRYTLLGKSAANGAVIRTLRKENPNVQEALKIIYKTPATRSHPLTVHPRVPKRVSDAVQQAILEIWETREGKSLLEAVLLDEPVKADYENDYQVLESLNLEHFFVAP